MLQFVPHRRSRAAFFRVTGLAVVLGAAMLMLGTRGFYVYGSCMEPNLSTGERVLASRVAYWFGTPQRGDVVIFKFPGDLSKNFVKRVVGLPGDTVEIRAGNLYVNGARAPEPYRQFRAHGDFGPELVRAGYLFVLGDNRDESNDSRYWGELPLGNVEAKAVLMYWPLTRCHLLR